MRLILLVFLVFIAACKETQADNDAGLYDPVAPAGSAFVRFLNLSPDGLEATYKNKKYPEIPAMNISPYYVFEKDCKSITLNGVEVQTRFDEGAFYTMTAQKIITDKPNDNRAKAIIAFYNMSDKPTLSVKVKEGTVMVLENVPPQEMAARDMNAVKIDFGVYDGDKLLKALDPQIIERGNHYSLVYTGQDLLFVTAETNTRF